MPFRFVESLEQLQFTEDAINEVRSYLVDDETMTETERLQVEEHGRPVRMRDRALLD